MSIILQAHPTTHNQMDVLRSMYRLLKAYFTKEKKREKFIQVFNDIL